MRKCSLYKKRCIVDVNLQIICKSVSYTLQKSTQHSFDRLYLFHPGYLFIKFDILESLLICQFDWCTYLLGLFHWGRRSGLSKLSGNTGNENLHIWSECVGNSCYVISFRWMNARVCTHCPCNAPKFRRILAQWMGSGCTCIEPKTWHSMHFPCNPINFANSRLRYCP